MNLLRKLLFPFAVLYGWITGFRNFLFDKEILKSYSFDVPVIAVGNLSVGGTGKTPQIEYLIRLLSPDYKVATLSRGYKRKSEGFLLADSASNAEILGDEPFQYHRKFKQIQVAVDANRKNGIEQLLSQNEKPDVILLDDAYQHRKVKAGFYILLTTYGDLYADDLMLPTGNLREGRNGAKRADVIIVTKCPRDLSAEAQQKIASKLKIGKQQHLFFSYIDYDDFIFSENASLAVSQIKDESKLLLAGIAKPKPFFDFLKNENDTILEFADHHDFSPSDSSEIKSKAAGRIVVTTEKDYVRLKDDYDGLLYFLPIKSQFITDAGRFDSMVQKFAAKK